VRQRRRIFARRAQLAKAAGAQWRSHPHVPILGTFGSAAAEPAALYAAGVCIVISVSGRLAGARGEEPRPADQRRLLVGLWLIELCPLLFSSVRRCIIKSNQSPIAAQILLARHASEQRLTAYGQ
jgi:hypothetical protein